MEGAIRNLAQRKLLCCMCGAFSDKWLNVAERCDIAAEGLQVDWGSPILPEAIDAKRFGEVFQRRATLARHWRHFLQDYPVVLMPVSAELPFKQDADLEGGDAVARLWEAQLPQIAFPALGLLLALFIALGLIRIAAPKPE